LADRAEDVTMIKVMWFLKRKDGLSLAEFRKWWLEDHVPDIVKHQAPHLKRYTVDIRVENDDLPGMPAEGQADWDGIAEQWFETRADFEAVYGKPRARLGATRSPWSAISSGSSSKRTSST
jgi:hypothetical protein